MTSDFCLVFSKQFEDKSLIVVEGQGECLPGNAMFMHDNPTDGTGPNNSVVICPRHPTEQVFSSAASLDVVAHEWGHGVVFASAGWTLVNLLKAQLHEGWADIIGHGAEWHKENVGTGPEKAEWNFDEDSRTQGTYSRKVNLDDGVYIYPNDRPFSYHAEDPCKGDYGHYCGMRLAVAFWLAADGGTDDPIYEHKNPVCQRATNPLNGTIPPGVDCSLEVAPLGVWPATRIFFRALTAYALDTDDWNDFAEYAKKSAHDIFSSPSPCDNADNEQNTVQDAFTAIGYPGPTPGRRYCHPMCCSS